MPLEMARYFVVLIPFLIYYFFLGLSLVVNQGSRLSVSKNFLHSIILVVLSIILFGNFLGASDMIQHAHRSEPYSPEYTHFLDTAFWARDSSPKDAYFAVRKPTTFYLLSNRYATSYGLEGSNANLVWAESTEKKLLDQYKTKNIGYIVLDRFSSSAYQLIYPIIKNNPDKFTLVYTTKPPETYVFKLNKW
jgi:hypothetical protein